MPDDPTPEEVARVDAWRERNKVEMAEQRRREDDERKEKGRLNLEAGLKGRTVARIEGKPDAYGDWHKATFVFEDGGSLEIDGYYGDGVELFFFTFHEPPGAE